MEDLTALIEIFSIFFCFAWLFGLVANLFNKFFKKKDFSIKDLVLFENQFIEKPIISSIVAIIVLAVILFNSSTFNELIGRDLPLSERTSGVYCYYVEAFKDSSTGKKYTVPARIEAHPWLEDDGHGGTDGGVDYYITALVFDDGRVIEFKEPSSASFRFTESYYDKYGNKWSCRLTEEPARSSLIQETSFVSTRSVVELCLIAGIILFNWFGGVSLAIQSKKDTYT